MANMTEAMAADPARDDLLILVDGLSEDEAVALILQYIRSHGE